MINHIKVIGFSLGLTMLYTCCFENHWYEAERHKIFRQEEYHPNVVRHIDQYENLLAFLVKNLDTIIAHKNQSHFVGFQNPDGTIATRQKTMTATCFLKVMHHTITAHCLSTCIQNFTR